MFDHDDHRPENRSDKIFIVIISAAFLILMGLEIASNFSPRKAGALLFVFFWIPLLVLHELGHAMVAKLFGWRVNEISLGFGRELGRFNAMGTTVKVKLFPLEGFVNCKPENVPYSNLKHAMIYFAGPGIELLVVGCIGLILGFGALFQPSNDYSVIILQSCAYAALAGAIINLIPMSIRHGDEYSMSDGAGILACLFRR